MADQKEPKKETVRISLPPPPETKPAGAERRDTVRINLPTRPPTSGPLRPPLRAPLPPPVSEPPPAAEPAPAETPPPFRAPFRPPTGSGPLPPSIVRASAMGANAAAAVEPAPTPPEPHPKKETARISILPDPVPATPTRSPTVNMAKTQPLIKTPEDERPLAPLTVSHSPPFASGIDAIPLPVLWALLGISALTFLIQLLNYFTV